jgi:hypothetical protein
LRESSKVVMRMKREVRCLKFLEVRARVSNRPLLEPS